MRRHSVVIQAHLWSRASRRLLLLVSGHDLGPVVARNRDCNRTHAVTKPRRAPMPANRQPSTVEASTMLDPNCARPHISSPGRSTTAVTWVPRYGIWMATGPSRERWASQRRSRGFSSRVVIPTTRAGESSVRSSSTRRPTRRGKSARAVPCRLWPRTSSALLATAGAHS